MVMRSASGSPLGQYRFAIAWLMMATPGALPASWSVNARPRRIGILNARK